MPRRAFSPNPVKGMGGLIGLRETDEEFDEATVMLFLAQHATASPMAHITQLAHMSRAIQCTGCIFANKQLLGIPGIDRCHEPGSVFGKLLRFIRKNEIIETVGIVLELPGDTLQQLELTRTKEWFWVLIGVQRAVDARGLERRKWQMPKRRVTKVIQLVGKLGDPLLVMIAQSLRALPSVLPRNVHLVVRPREDGRGTFHFLR